MSTGYHAEDRSLLVVLLEAHQGLWSQLNGDNVSGEEHRHLTIHGFLQQVTSIVGFYSIVAGRAVG